MTTKFTFWQEDDGKFLGYLNDYPDHWRQGETLLDLKEHLRDLIAKVESAGALLMWHGGKHDLYQSEDRSDAIHFTT